MDAGGEGGCALDVADAEGAVLGALVVRTGHEVYLERVDFKCLITCLVNTNSGTRLKSLLWYCLRSSLPASLRP